MSTISKKEIQFFEGMLKKIESNAKSILLKPWFNTMLWVFCAAAFLFAFQFHVKTRSSAVLIGVSSLVGIAVGVVSILQNGERSWPYI